MNVHMLIVNKSVRIQLEVIIVTVIQATLSTAMKKAVMVNYSL